MTRHQKRATISSSRLCRVHVGDTANDYSDLLDRADIHERCFEEVFQLLVTFRDHKENELDFKKVTGASSKTLARRFLRHYGDRIWGNDRKFIKPARPNGGRRYAARGLPGDKALLVDILSLIFKRMRNGMYPRKQKHPAPTSTRHQAVETNIEEAEAGVGRANAGPLKDGKDKYQPTRLSRTVRHDDGETDDDEDSGQDSSARLVALDRKRTRKIADAYEPDEDDLPYDFRRAFPAGAINVHEMRWITQLLETLRDMEAANPTAYTFAVMQVLRLYRRGRPV